MNAIKDFHQVFGTVFSASGARQFQDKPYPFQVWLPFLRGNWHGAGFISKTVTIEPRKGNMPRGRDQMTPRWFFPRCIKVWADGHALNAVGLSNPGFPYMLKTGIWQRRTDAFGISFAPVSLTTTERLEEIREFVRLMAPALPDFHGIVAFHINYGCPNTGVSHDDFAAEITSGLELLARLQKAIVVNTSPTVDGLVLAAAADHPYCAALWPGNTINWGEPGIYWHRFSPDGISPMIKRGFDSPGGLSGPVCLQFVLNTIARFRQRDETTPVIACNGVRSINDVIRCREYGATGVGFGVPGFHRVWRLQGMIRAAHACFDRKEGWDEIP